MRPRHRALHGTAKIYSVVRSLIFQRRVRCVEMVSNDDDANDNSGAGRRAAVYTERQVPRGQK